MVGERLLKPVPEQIRASGGEIAIRWSDAHDSVYAPRELRLACKCAACVDEWTHEARVKVDQLPPRIEPKSIEVVGHYALQFFWSDGHSSGIYTYDYLREICACKTCAGERNFDV